MEKDKKVYISVDDYINSFSNKIKMKLEEFRNTIKEQAPQASEKISYGMPTFYLNGNLVHFAAHSKHIGFYPTPSAIERFKDELLKYKTSKGAIQFPIHEPLPIKLIKKIVSFRVEENLKKNKEEL